MTKFIPNLGEISTKFSGFENEQAPTAGEESKQPEMEPPFEETPSDDKPTPTQQVQHQGSQNSTLPPNTFISLGGKPGLETRQAEENTAPTPSNIPIENNPTTASLDSTSPNSTGESTYKLPNFPKPNISVTAASLLAGVKQFSGKITDKLQVKQKTEVDRENLSQKILASPWLDPKNPLYRKPKFWVAVGLGVGVTGGAIALGTTWWSLESNLPDPSYVFTFVRDGTLTIKAENGQILQQIGPATREKVKLDEMPTQLVQAFIASEDARFYQHKGVDYQGITRALISNLTAKSVVEGGSTITQQLARIVFLNQERTWQRKLREMMLAGKIEQKMTKQQILERYLNLVYLGEGAYGVADAAWVYYSKPLKDLTLPEIATIVGVTPAPSIYSPLVNPQVAEQRRNTVLQRMQTAGFITAEQAKQAETAPMMLQPAPPKRLSTEAAYFTSYVQQELPKLVSPDAMEAGGLTVETSLNPQWQDLAEAAVEKAVKEYGPGQRFGQAALVSIDPHSGEVKAMVGGTDFSKTNFNRVTQAQRQPGSTFKGFVYTTAIAAGFSPYRGYLDAPITVDNYTPKNFDGENAGWISLRDALARSINVVALKVMIDVGFQPTIDIAHKMGIKSELKPTYSLALGASEVNLMELTSAYGTFATSGQHTEVHGIRRVLDQRGKVIYQANFKPQQAIDPDTSSIMTWMLQEVVKGGTGRAANLNNRPVAGKTGTSDQARDLWFIGYIPQLVTGVWLGNDDNKPTYGSSSTAARTWYNFMSKALEGMPVEKFPERPPKLEGRKATIAIVPIKPGKVYSPKVASTKKDNDDDNVRPTSRRIRTQNNTDSTPVRRASRQNNPNSDTTSTARSQRRKYTETYQTVRRRRRSAEVTASTDTDNNTSTSTRRSRSERPRRRLSSADRTSTTTQTAKRSQRRQYTPSTSNNNDAPRTERVSRRRRSADQSQVRRRSADNSGSQSNQTSRSRRRSSSTSANSAPATTSSRRSNRTSSAPAAPPQAPSLARPQPAAAPPTIELNSHQ